MFEIENADQVVGGILVGAGLLALLAALLCVAAVAVGGRKRRPSPPAPPIGPVVPTLNWKAWTVELDPATDPEHDAAFDAHVEESLRAALPTPVYDRLVCEDIERAEGWLR